MGSGTENGSRPLNKMHALSPTWNEFLVPLFSIHDGFIVDQSFVQDLHSFVGSVILLFLVTHYPLPLIYFKLSL